MSVNEVFADLLKESPPQHWGKPKYLSGRSGNWRTYPLRGKPSTTLFAINDSGDCYIVSNNEKEFTQIFVSDSRVHAKYAELIEYDKMMEKNRENSKLENFAKMASESLSSLRHQRNPVPDM